MVGRQLSRMGSVQEEEKPEGWLYLIQTNRLGQRRIRKCYFILEGSSLNCFRSAPVNDTVPGESILIEPHIRVQENGREDIDENVYFTFTLSNISSQRYKVELGAKSSEEAARWIRSLKEVALGFMEHQGCEQKSTGCSNRMWLPFRRSHRRSESQMSFTDWTANLSSDVVAPSTWTIFGCTNGLRLFRETQDGDSCRKHRNEHPAVMAVGVVDGCTESIFQTIMSLGPSRSEWDFCFSKGRVVDCVNGHADIIHKRLKSDWLPWGSMPRDLLLQRYWRREDDGTYVILYHSVVHKACQPERGCIRACLKSGGYVISPVYNGRQSVVKHMLSIDWKLWQSFFSLSPKCITIKMLGRIAALREYYRIRMADAQTPDLPCCELNKEARSLSCKKWGFQDATHQTGITIYEDSTHELKAKTSEGGVSCRSVFDLHDTSDEFFDVLEESEYDSVVATNTSDACFYSQDQCQNKITHPSNFVKRLHERTGQKRIFSEVQVETIGENVQWTYGSTLQEDPACNLLCSWTIADPSTFLIRGPTYLQDHCKIKATSTLMRMIAADWLKSDRREDDLAARPNSIVQKHASQGGKEFFFIVNIQVPGSTRYSLALYFMMDCPLESVPLLERFVKGDDAFRNSRFKLIPYISKGSWIVKQSVGKKACLIGQALEINYFHGKNYIELGIDIGSSAVARGVVGLVLGYLNSLVIEMAFLVQGNKVEELPEFLLGTCRLNHLDAAKSVVLK